MVAKLRLFKVIVVAIFVFCLAMLVTGIKISENEKSYASEQFTDRLPDVALSTLDGKQVMIGDYPENLPKAIVFFKPECGYCANQLQQIAEDSLLANATNLWFLSPANFLDIMNFFAEPMYKNLDETRICSLSKEHIQTLFGVKNYPTLLIYSSDGALLNVLKGVSNPTTIKNSMGLL